MRLGRKCIYRNCGHHQNMDNKCCAFHTFPKNVLSARQWLNAPGADNVTPKKLLPSWTICSCHFPNGKDKNSVPMEYIEEYDSDDDGCSAGDGLNQDGLKRQRGTPVKVVDLDMQSPARKTRRFTPTTQGAVDALMCLATAVPSPEKDRVLLEQEEGMQPYIKEEILSPSCIASYSPKRSHWSLRANVVRSSARKTFTRMLDFSHSQNALHEDDDLGCSIIADENISIPICDENMNVIYPEQCIISSIPNTTDKIYQETSADQDTISCIPKTAFTHEPPSTMEPSPIAEICNETALEPEVKNTRSIGIQCNRSFLCYDRCKLLAEPDFRYYTGLSQEMFTVVFEFLGGEEICSAFKYRYNSKTPTRIRARAELTPQDELLMTLLRLRRGIPLRDLKVLFNISEGHASRIVYTWVRVMSLEFKKLEELMFVSTRAQDDSRPKCFEQFQNLRVIIDCTEFRIQTPNNLDHRRNSYSQYKSANTIKFLVGISCMGGLSYISEGYEGSISDRSITEKSGFLNLLEPGDAVMADKGFDIEDICDELDVLLLMPSFVKKRNNLTARELIWSRAIAESRVHVETYIGKVKDFRLIRYVIPNSMLAVASDLVRVCAMLVNFQYPFISLHQDDELN